MRRYEGVVSSASISFTEFGWQVLADSAQRRGAVGAAMLLPAELTLYQNRQSRNIGTLAASCAFWFPRMLFAAKTVRVFSERTPRNQRQRMMVLKQEADSATDRGYSIGFDGALTNATRGAMLMGEVYRCFTNASR